MRVIARAAAIIVLGISLAHAGVLDPDLVTKLDASAPNELVRFMVTMEAQADYNELISATAGFDKWEKREYVVTYLQDLANASQREALDYLRSYEASGKVTHLQSASIVNILHGKATPEVIRGLEFLPGIAAVHHDPDQYMLFHSRPQKESSYKTDETDEIAWGVLDINADDVWQMGFTGTGVIVGVLDTGCNYNHVDLADHMWDGGPQYPNHGWDFHNNDNDPMDDGSGWSGGHGTHCSGSVASDGTAGSQCGVAPDAQIMAVKVLSGDGYGSEGPVISGIDFAAAQGADVFSMSLGWQSTGQKYEFRTACNNALAAGLIGAIAAGNEGNSIGWYPIPGNVRTPGDVPPPWLNPDQVLTGGLSCVVTIGATNIGQSLAGFSSRGPVTWEDVGPWNDYAYAGGSMMGLIDPDVSAPGENIKSLDFQNIYGYEDGWSGTSMATPHVAGTLALMLDKDPALSPAQLDMYLETTAADWGSPGKDNDYGAGRIDAAAAVSAIPGGGTPPDMDITLTPTGSTSLPSSGGTLYYDVVINNNEPTTTYFTAWLEWTYPNGTSSGALVLRNLNMPSGGQISRSLQMTVAGSEPGGSYTFWGRCGSSYGGDVYAEDSFGFTKGTDGGAGSGTAWVEETKVYGWDDDEFLSLNVPDQFELGQNYPNPFNPTTTIPFAISQSGNVSLRVYDLQGRLAATILSGELSAGHYEVNFDASELSSGVYIYRLDAPGYSQSMKLALVK
ncbi:S8 family peptidase [bacterium]|nr:S8 family peptidase [bacterium]